MLFTIFKYLFSLSRQFLNMQMTFGRLEKSGLPWEPNFFIALGVLPVVLLAYSVSMVYAAN